MTGTEPTAGGPRDICPLARSALEAHDDPRRAVASAPANEVALSVPERSPPLSTT